MYKTDIFISTLIMIVIVGIIGFSSYKMIYPNNDYPEQKLLKKIIISSEMNDTHNTIELVTEYLSEYENSDKVNEVRLIAAQLLYNQNDYEGARLYIDKILMDKNTLNNHFVYAVIILGKMMKVKQQYDPITMNYLQNAYLKASIESKNEIAVLLGYGAIFNKDYQLALRFFNSAGGELSLIGRARVYIEQGNYPMAIQEYINLFDFYPNSRYIESIRNNFSKQCFYYATTLRDAKLYLTAINFYQKVINYSNSDFYIDAALTEMGNIYYQMKDFDQARIFYLKALDNKETEYDSTSLYQYAVMEYELKNNESALKSFKKLIEKYPLSQKAEDSKQWIQLISKELVYQ